MSVALRSCVARIPFNFSGWLDKEGGARRRVLGTVLLLWPAEYEERDSRELVRITEGAIIVLQTFKSANCFGWLMWDTRPQVTQAPLLFFDDFQIESSYNGYMDHFEWRKQVLD